MGIRWGPALRRGAEPIARQAPDGEHGFDIANVSDAVVGRSLPKARGIRFEVFFERCERFAQTSRAKTDLLAGVFGGLHRLRDLLFSGRNGRRFRLRRAFGVRHGSRAIGCRGAGRLFPDRVRTKFGGFRRRRRRFFFLRAVRRRRGSVRARASRLLVNRARRGAGGRGFALHRRRRIFPGGRGELFAHRTVEVDAAVIREHREVDEDVRHLGFDLGRALGRFEVVARPLEAFEKFGRFDRNRKREVFGRVKARPIALVAELRDEREEVGRGPGRPAGHLRRGP